MDINSLVKLAQDGLLNGSEEKLLELITIAKEWHKGHLINLHHSFSFIDRQLIDAIYIETLWEIVRKYDGEYIYDIYGYLYATVRNKVTSLARKELTHEKNCVSLEFVVVDEEDGNNYVMQYDVALGVEQSAEDEYLNELYPVEDFTNDLDENNLINDFEKALILHRIEYETPFDDVIKILGAESKYKNKQQLWRSSIKKLRQGAIS